MRDRYPALDRAFEQDIAGTGHLVEIVLYGVTGEVDTGQPVLGVQQVHTYPPDSLVAKDKVFV